MRILAIRGKNLASLAEPFEILLNEGPLEQAGLFAITGQTGAGKSTILDALCLALYDEIPRLPAGQGFAVGHKDEDEKLRVTSNDVRSVLRRGTSHAYAEVDFIGKDKLHYRARWEVSKARGKADGRLQAQEVILTNIASGQRIGQGKKSTLEAISELMDLNFDQFRRSVLLAQGDFSAFLKAKKDERSSLLERITGTDIYSELSMAAFERARQEKDLLGQIASRLQDQIPLDEAARLLLEQQRDQLILSVAELDKQIAGNQKIIEWYVENKKLQAAAKQALDGLACSRQNWDSAEPERLLIQKVEAAQPLRPMLSQFKTASAELQESRQKLVTGSEQQISTELKLQESREHLEVLATALLAAELQQQQAKPVLIQARALDTRLEVMKQAVTTLATEEVQLHETVNNAEKEHQSLLSQQTQQNRALQQLNLWLEQNKAIKPVANEWSRWEADLERYQALNNQKLAIELKAEQLKLSVSHDERNLAELKLALEASDKRQTQHQLTLVELKQQDSQQSFDDLLQTKENLEFKRGQLTQVLSLITNVRELKQFINQDTEKLAATKQASKDGSLELQTLTQQQLVNGAALGEAKKALVLIQATTHKNAEQFRALLQEDLPCPVCGGLEHPWKHQSGITDKQAFAQAERVTELEKQHEILIKKLAEITKEISQGQEHCIALEEKLVLAKAKMSQYVIDWSVLVLDVKADFSDIDEVLISELKSDQTKILADLEQIKQQEKAVLTVQKQLKTTQDLFNAGQAKKEKLAGEYATMDRQCVTHKTEWEHGAKSILDTEKQLKALVEVLATPFAELENWQVHLYDSTERFRQDCAAKVQQHQRTEREIETSAKTLEKINRDEQLFSQSLKQAQLQHQLKQGELNIHEAEQQKLSDQRAELLPNVTANSYEQTLNQKLLEAKTTHLQAGVTVNKVETELATCKQNQQHWQTETDRRSCNLEKAFSALNQSLEKLAIDQEQLNLLLEKDSRWLAEQKTNMAGLERLLQESIALVKVKNEACHRHQVEAITIAEEDAVKLSGDLQQQRQLIHSHKEEQVILLREDDKKINAGQVLKAEFDRQHGFWAQWESLNELIGSKNGAKFRVFAQSLTLEALLAHSNQHLKDFAKRYALQRVPGSDLELQIIDRDMADDVRSVHSLSGGESFLVSLALALGLASLSSNKTQVESLFIDEGFGSLDPETLDMAIASLDTLQALGRKVGVISHVPILVERIGAKVLVEKQGGGRSRVVIAGGY